MMSAINMRQKISGLKRILGSGIFTLCVCFALFKGEALAEGEFFEHEKAVFAFHALSNSEPNFTEWIEESAPYKTAPPEYKDEVFEKEALRLKWGMATYDVSSYIKMDFEVITIVEPAGKNKPAVLKLYFLDEKEDYIPYFPFPFGDQWIALLVQGLEIFSRIPLHEKELAHIKTFMPQNNTPYPAMLHMEIKPISADGEKPFQLDGVDQWLMMGDIASLRFDMKDEATKTDKTLWEYYAPWYEEQTGNQLSTLRNLKR